MKNSSPHVEENLLGSKNFFFRHFDHLNFSFSVFRRLPIGPWSVKVVNELDHCSKDAQDMLLTYLDRMKPDHAFLGTTDLDAVAARL